MNNRLGDLRWGLISKYRVQIMGFAILWIMFHHGNIKLPAEVDILNVIFDRGNNGVDIFLFLSGIGLVYSFSSNSDILSFYKKRFVRVVLPYAAIGGIFWAILDIVVKRDVLRFFKDFLLISFWQDGVIRVWFIALILLLYLVFPVVYRYFFHSEKGILLRLVILLGIVVCVNYAIYRGMPSRYYDIEIAITRIPVFLIGVYCGKKVKENHVFTYGEALLLFSLFGSKIFLNMYEKTGAYTRYWYIVLAICMCVGLCMIFEMCPEKRVFLQCKKVLTWAGKWSLELYIVHVWIRVIVKKFEHLYSVGGYDLNKYGILNFVICTMISLIVTWLAVALEKKIFFRSSK